MFDIAPIWVPRVKDLASGIYAQRWFLYSTVTATSTSLATSATDPNAICPVDKARIVCGVGIALDPGATEISTQLTVQILAPGSLTPPIAYFPMPRDTIVGGQRGAYSTPIDAIMLPGEIIQAIALIGTATNPKTLQFSAWGYDIPRGNIQ